MKILDRLALRLGYVPRRTSRNLSCAWCGQPFSWFGDTLDEHPIYCKSTHKKRASEARAKRRKAFEESAPKPPKLPEPPKNMNLVGRCPTPYKQTHFNFELAQVVIDRVDPEMQAYKCKCGGIHIGHSRKVRNG